MTRHKIHAVRAFGWQLDYRPDGWLPLGIRGELGVSWHGPRWHILRLGRLGCVTLGRLTPPSGGREVTVNLAIDTKPFQDALHRQVLALEQVRWQMIKVSERTRAKLWWAEQMDAAYGRYGWDWPGPIRATVTGAATCEQTAASCVCTMPVGHVEAGDPVHVCDPDECGGQWTGTYDQARFDGGSGWEPVAAPGGLRRRAGLPLLPGVAR